MSRLFIVQGDSSDIQLTVVSAAGEAVDLTGATVYFTAKSSLDLTDAEAEISKTVSSHTDAENGETQISLTTEDTDVEVGTYHYDVQIDFSDGSRQSIKRNILEISQGVRNDDG